MTEGLNNQKQRLQELTPKSSTERSSLLTCYGHSSFYIWEKYINSVQVKAVFSMHAKIKISLLFIGPQNILSKMLKLRKSEKAQYIELWGSKFELEINAKHELSRTLPVVTWITGSLGAPQIKIDNGTRFSINLKRLRTTYDLQVLSDFVASFLQQVSDNYCSKMWSECHGRWIHCVRYLRSYPEQKVSARNRKSVV